MNMDAMEDQFYDGICLFLEERGINDEFCQEMVRCATDMESNLYINSMSRLNDFLKSN